ncbi:hypothetical protein K9B35_00315 [Sphingomonas sp. R647]|uniref:hypothetical protein n=1 Tax=Sphingomonas sp. R647 TaxID=2875233 RepID=UPI001CD2941D|nr:hypothetical protein [Sphingomonas sp. R647]MCA1196398.1 hypothetical protein [Sphingomonas sp. R647]
MTTSATSRLERALEAVYREFARPGPDVIEGCPCCISTRGIDVLLTTPLRELTGQQLWRYVSGAFLTVGGEEDFQYLLPRILDVSISDPGNANDPEIVIGKLPLANWRAWSAPKRRVLEEFLDAWFERALVRDSAEADEGWIGTEAESVLCGAARAGLPLRGWLIRLNEPFAAPVLIDLKERFPDELSAFWEDAPGGFAELSAILTQGRA